MGVYSRIVFPRLCDLLLNTSLVGRQRQEVLAPACGHVLEIGFGTGLNLPHYPVQVGKITTVDPNAGMHRLAQKRIKHTALVVDQLVASVEQVPFPNGAFDCVVSTFTLCSIEHVDQALAEVHRVLKPGGQFLFLEHGLSPELKVQRWQRRLNWLQKRLGDGCRLDRNIRQLIAAQPFSAVEIQEFYLERSPKTHGYLYRGTATKHD